MPGATTAIGLTQVIMPIHINMYNLKVILKIYCEELIDNLQSQL